MSSTSVSVVIPTFNRKEFLRESLESVHNQSYENIETVVIDGGSTDGTSEYLRSLDNKNLTTIFRENPKGQANARNKGIEVSEGEYILFLDDDDILHENAIEKMVNVLNNQEKTCAGIYTAEEQFGEIRKLKAIPPGKCKNIFNNSFGTSCTLFRSDILEDLDGFNETFDTSEDLEFIIRLFNHNYTIYGINKPLYERRMHEDQKTDNLRGVVEANQRILERYRQDLLPKSRFERHEKISRLHIKLNEPENALQSIENLSNILKDHKEGFSTVEKLERYEKISRLYIKLGKNEKASKSLENLFELTNELNDIEKRYSFLNKALNLYIEIQDYKEAHSVLREILELKNNKCTFEGLFSTYRGLALKAVEIGSIKEARLCLKTCIRLKPSDKFSYYFYFWLLFGERGYRTGRKLESILKKKS